MEESAPKVRDAWLEFPSTQGDVAMFKRVFSKKATGEEIAERVPRSGLSADLDLYRQVFGRLPCDDPSS